MMTESFRERSLPSDVYVFGTCVVDVAFADAGMDAIAVIEALGIRVHYPEKQTCCGQPALTSGVLSEARAVARAQLQLFPEAWPIVILSGSCTGMFRHHYPTLFSANDPDYARALGIAGRAIEWMEFLASCPTLMAVNKTPVSVVVHTACSAQRETATGKATLQVLSYWDHVSVKEADHGTECCGFGGTFSVRYPKISGAMVADKCAALVDTGADRLVSSDCACLLNINGRLAKEGRPMVGEHIASLVRSIVLGESNV